MKKPSRFTRKSPSAITLSDFRSGIGKCFKLSYTIKIISSILCFCFLFTQSGIAQLLPQLTPTLPQPLPLLRYLSINSANPFNYFNFLLDKGLPRQGGADPEVNLNQEAKKLIHYFFLGITLPPEAFWVNLKPAEPERITSDELSRTDMGRILLEQDLQLKKDVSRYLHPKHPKGKEYWERLYTTIGKEKAKKAKITTSNRVWITPAEAVVLETEDGALVAKATLKVLLESEYLTLKKQGLSPSEKGLSPKGTDPEVFPKGTIPTTEEENLRLISESLMKEIILPALTEEINTSPTYAPLRQIYHSLILAEWFKRKQGLSPCPAFGGAEGTDPNNPYSKYINSGTTKGLESELPWEKQTIWQEYLKSYQEGEYKLQDTLFGLKRMYWSGGVIINLSGSSSPLITIAKNELPKHPDLLKNIPKNPGETLVVADTGNKDLGEVGTRVISFDREPEREKEAPPTDKSLPALSEDQSQKKGASSISSPIETFSSTSPRDKQKASLFRKITVKYIGAFVTLAMIISLGFYTFTDGLIKVARSPKVALEIAYQYFNYKGEIKIISLVSNSSTKQVEEALALLKQVKTARYEKLIKDIKAIFIVYPSSPGIKRPFQAAGGQYDGGKYLTLILEPKEENSTADLGARINHEYEHYLQLQKSNFMTIPHEVGAHIEGYKTYLQLGGTEDFDFMPNLGAALGLVFDNGRGDFKEKKELLQRSIEILETVVKDKKIVFSNRYWEKLRSTAYKFYVNGEEDADRILSVRFLYDLRFMIESIVLEEMLTSEEIKVTVPVELQSRLKEIIKELRKKPEKLSREGPLVEVSEVRILETEKIPMIVRIREEDNKFILYIPRSGLKKGHSLRTNLLEALFIFNKEKGAGSNLSDTSVSPIEAQSASSPLAEPKKSAASPLLNKEQAMVQIDKFKNVIRQGKYQQKAVVDLKGLPSEVEVILVGDLHARLDNLKKILNTNNNLGKIQRGEAILVILGDAVHSERRDELAEMDSSLEIMQFIMDLKIQNPDNVYYILGNHDYLSPLFSKGGVQQGVVYKDKLQGLYGQEYIRQYEEFLKASPLIVIGNGFMGVHGGPIKNANLEEIQNVDMEDEGNPIVRQAQWGRYPESYNEQGVLEFLKNMEQPNAQFIVGHSPKRDGNWYWQLMSNHHVIFAGHDRVGYAIVQNGNVNFIEVTDASPRLELDKKQSQEEAIALNIQEVIDYNLKQIHSEQFNGVLMSESIGGNAGPGRAAVNMAIETKGRIIEIGNIQNLSPETRSMLEQGKAAEVGFSVRMFGTEGKAFEFYTWTGLNDTQRKIMQIVENRLNEIAKKDETEEAPIKERSLISTTSLKGGKSINVDYKKSIDVILAPGIDEIKFSIYRHDHLPSVIKNRFNPEVKYFILDEDSVSSIAIGIEEGFKGLHDGEIVEIGRSNPGRFNLTNTVSRNHVKIERHGDNITIIDLNSTNGTEVRYTEASPLEKETASSAITTSEGQSPTGTVPTEHGGIDLSQIELTLKDQRYISGLNPADLKVLRAAKALKDEWDSLSLLYIHEIMLLLKDNLIQDLQNKELLLNILNQLKLKEFLDPQAINFLQLLKSQESISSLRIAAFYP